MKWAGLGVMAVVSVACTGSQSHQVGPERAEAGVVAEATTEAFVTTEATTTTVTTLAPTTTTFTTTTLLIVATTPRPTSSPAPEPSTACTAIPAYIVARESGCRNIPNAQGSGCDGYYQICAGTWNNYRGYPNALSAPKSVQDAKAAELWANGAGCGHWDACG